VSAAPGRTGAAIDVPEPAATINAFKALALTSVTSLDGSALTALVRGEIASVFGTAYDQEGVNPAIRLSGGAHGALARVLEIDRHDGRWNRGRVRAVCEVGGSDLVAAAVEIAWQAAQVFAMQVGLQLCLADAGFEVGAHGQCEVEVDQSLAPGAGDLTVDVMQIDLIPRPLLRTDAEFRRDGAVVARVRGLTLEIREAAGQPVGPEVGGVIPRFFGRRNVFGDRALLNEFHMTHSARGGLDIALGPEFARYAGRRATRMPNHGLQLCDRVMAVDGTRGDLTRGASHTEYDSPADSWYYAESANASMPNVIYMETSLQSALLLGYFLGATLTAPEEDYCLRNLDGTATVLREVDLRDKTIQQTSRLMNTTVMVGAVLQTFSYELSVDGEPFYSGESLFGFFNEPALAKQNGLDNGAYTPPWLDNQPEHSTTVRTIDVAARRQAGTGIRCSTGHLALLDSVEVVDGGGKFGNGYLRAVRPVRQDDWFFKYHFYLDPVMPGSLGVEAVLQALQEWAVDANLAADLVNPQFVLATNLPSSWRYRGQILADDRAMTLEVHIREVERRHGRVRVVADASVWKPGMRIYELTDVAVELRGDGAEPW
jgi:3-hydroxymyristoyl/3-hydroxydecanoyl-(acyl carrier protein) dehydratase